MLTADAGSSSAAQAGANQFLAAGGGGVGAVGPFSLPSVQSGGMVYLGSASRSYNGQGGDTFLAGRAPAQTGDNWVSPQDAYQMWYYLPDKAKADIVAKGVVGGLIKQGSGLLEGADLWKKLVTDAARYGASGQRVGPMDLLNSYVSMAGLGMTDKQRFLAGKGNFPSGSIFDKNGKYTNTYRDGDFIVDQISGKRTYVGPKFKTQSQTQVDLTDPETAKALVTSVFQSLLGRDPGQGELGSFAQALASAEQANPTTTTTTNEYNSAGDVVNQTTSNSGGLSQQGKEYLLEQQAKKNPEYGATQAATTYMNATQRAIWGGPSA